jgi:hypothetical protein
MAAAGDLPIGVTELELGYALGTGKSAISN